VHVLMELAVIKECYQIYCTGIRLLGGRFTDIQEARALSHLNDIVDVYSNSWGPPDHGDTVAGPGPLTQMALERATREVSEYQGSTSL